MPNHVRTRIKVEDEETFNKMWDTFVTEDKDEKDKDKRYSFDFEKIIPMPKHIFRGNLGQEEEEKYGKENCWLGWSIKNWGTKWNAYDFDYYQKFDNEFSFQTAWSHPTPIIREISKVFPDVELQVRYADEDIGSNLGEYTIKDGEVTSERRFLGELSIEDEKELFALRVRQ